MPDNGPFARLSSKVDAAVRCAVEKAQSALEGLGLHLYESSYVDLVLCGESTRGPVALVAGSHTKNFPYYGTQPWDHCLLLVGDTGYTFTSRVQDQSLHFALSLDDRNPTTGMLRFQGEMLRASDRRPETIQFEFTIDLTPFPARLVGESYNFLEIDRAVGMNWTPYGLRSNTASVTINQVPLAITNIQGACERGILTNLRAHDFAIAYDYLAVARPGPGGYAHVHFVSKALHPDTPLGSLIDWYLQSSATAVLTVESGVLGDGNPHAIPFPSQADSTPVLFEEVVDLGAAKLQRQMVKLRDGSGNPVYGLREIFTAT